MQIVAMSKISNAIEIENLLIGHTSENLQQCQKEC
jgi:hypothetical protein